MGIFDEIGKRAAKVGQNVADEAKKLAETARINDKIKEENRSLEQLYLQFGRECYEEFKDIENSGTRKMRVDAITAAIKRINSLHQEEQNIRGVRSCTACGKEAGTAAGFCPHCGSVLEAPVIPVQNTLVCGKCGAALEEDSQFCVNCGSKVD